MLAQNFNEIRSATGVAGLMVKYKPAYIIQLALPYIFGVAGIILLFMITSSGFQMMTSKGDPKVMQTAQAKLTTAVIGIIILFSSFFITQLIMRFIGINLIIPLF